MQGRCRDRLQDGATEAGAPEALRFHYFDGPHDLPADALAEALAWLARVL